MHLSSWRLPAVALSCALFACAKPDEPGGNGGQTSPVANPAPAPARLVSSPGWPQLQTSVPLYELTVAPSDLQALEDNIDDHSFEVPGTFALDGRTWPVTVGYRGHSTRYLPKKSFEVKFPDDDPFDGNQKALQLLAEWKDGGLLTEKLWWDLSAAAGLRVPSARFVRLDLNGSFYGVMVEVESIKKQFFRNHGFDEDSDLYRCGQFDCEMRDPPPLAYQQDWVKQTNENTGRANLDAFLAQVNRTSPSQFHDFIESRFEYDEYLEWLAVDAAISNRTIEDSRSYLVWDPASGRWAYVPWDLNNAVSLMNRTNGWPQWPNTDRALKDFTVYDPEVFAIMDERRSDPWFVGLQPAWSSLNTRMLDDPRFREALIQKLRRLLDRQFRNEEIDARVDAMHALIAPYLAQDPFVDQTLADHSAQYLKDYVQRRRDQILQDLSKLQDHGATDLKLDRIGLDAGRKPFVEITNQSNEPMHLAGMWLSAWLRAPTQVKLGDVTIPAKDRVRLEGSTLAKLAPVPGESQFGLFEADGQTAVDTIFLPPLAPGDTWGRSETASETWEKLQ